MQHIINWVDGSHDALVRARDMEPHCDRAGRRVLAAFEADRERLLAEWNAEPLRAAAALAPEPNPEPQPAAPALSAAQRRAAKAATDLARWERKLKLAKTKVAKYRAKVKRYRKRGVL